MRSTGQEGPAAGRRRLWEREEAITLLEGALDRARDGAGSAVFLIGEAGLGKTSLVEQTCRLADEIDIAVGRGNEMERVIPFGIVDQAFSSIAGSPLAIADFAAGPTLEPSAPFHRALRGLEARVGRRPLLLALDDIHWADPDSLGLVSFLTRRLSGLPVLLVATMRPWPPHAEEVCRSLVESGAANIQRLAPLSRPATSELLSERSAAPVSEANERRVWELCEGNPLLVEQLALSLGRDEEVPGLTEGSPRLGEHLLLSRFAGLDRPSMLCARAASMLGARFRPDLAARGAGLDGDAIDRALESLCRSGLIVDAPDGRMRFAHPLFAHALYEDTPRPVRDRLHARFFGILAVLGFDDEACEHAMRADLVGDDHAAEVCERAGRAALAAGAVATAAGHLQAAVRFRGGSASPALLLVCGEALASCGRMEEAAAVCHRLEELPDLRWQDRVETLRMLGRALYLTGFPDHGEDALERAASLAEEHDPAAAIGPLLDQSLSIWLASGPVRALPVAARARALADQLDDADLRERAAAPWGHLALESGDPAGLEATDPLSRLLDEDGGALVAAELIWPWAPLYHYAMNCNYSERYAESLHAFERARAVVERAGAANALATLAIYISNVAIRRGDLGRALREGERASEFADLTPGVSPYAALVRAETLAWMGRLDEVEACCAEAENGAPGQWFAEMWVAYVRGMRLLWLGQEGASECFLTAERLTKRVGIREPCHMLWAAHAPQAHIEAGRIDAALEVVDWVEQCAKPLGCRFPRFAGMSGRAHIAAAEGDYDRAESEFIAAIALLDDGLLPLQRIEASLALGGLLRRCGRPVDSRPHLAEALALAERCAAARHAQAAAAELKLAGGRRRRGSEHRDELTAAESRVAEQAARGLSNADIAGHLHLSVNTVESHLKRIYSKLDIHSRRDLMNGGAATFRPAGPSRSAEV